MVERPSVRLGRTARLSGSESAVVEPDVVMKNDALAVLNRLPVGGLGTAPLVLIQLIHSGVPPLVLTNRF